MGKMSNSLVFVHLIVWGLCILCFLVLLFVPRPLVQRLGRLHGFSVWLLSLVVLGIIILYMFITGTDMNGFLD